MSRGMLRPGDELMVRAMKEAINAEMLKAAEPVIQEALKAVEKAMRERLAKLLIAQVDESFSVTRMQNQLHIVINRGAE